MRHGRVAALAVLALLWVTGCSDPSDDPGAPLAAAPSPPAPERSAESGPGTPSPEASKQKEQKEQGQQKEQRPRTKSRVLYLGDSLAMETQTALADRVSAGGRATVHSAPHSGTTLCDYLTEAQHDSLVPPRDKAAALVAAERPSVVVLQFWGNSWGYTPCMGSIPQGGSARYYTRYAADAKALTGQIAAAARIAGIPRPRIVWVLQAPDAFSPDRIRRVNDIYRAQAAKGPDTVADAGRQVSPAGARYTWTRQLPCNDEERARARDCSGGLTSLHREDDHLHFCLAPTTKNSRPCPVRSPGIVRYTNEIAEVVDVSLRGKA